MNTQVIEIIEVSPTQFDILSGERILTNRPTIGAAIEVRDYIIDTNNRCANKHFHAVAA